MLYSQNGILGNIFLFHYESMETRDYFLPNRLDESRARLTTFKNLNLLRSIYVRSIIQCMCIWSKSTNVPQILLLPMATSRFPS